MEAQTLRRVGHYAILEALARGGMAEVLVAQKDGQAEVCVLKRLLEEVESKANAARRLHREAQIAARLEHPNIAQVLEAGLQDNTFCLAMEFIAGADVEGICGALYDQEKMLPYPMSIAVGLDVLAGLTVAHDLTDASGRNLDIVHRDLSPRNIMLSFDGAVKIIDFGIARGSFADFRTAPGTLVGTLRYCSPEQAMTLSVDRRSDLFTLSVVLHEILSGYPLVPHGEPAEILRNVAQTPAPSIHALNPSVPEAVDQVILRGLAKDPDDRWQTASAFRDALSEAAGPLPDDLPGLMGTFVRGLFGDRAKHTDELIALGRRRFDQGLATPDGTVDLDGLEDTLRSTGPASSAKAFRGTERYRLIRTIGAGGMGEVYEVEDSVRKTNIALKRMLAVGSWDLLSFKREFRTTVELDHPNVVKLYELEESDEALFYTMELIDGIELTDYIDDEQPSVARLLRALPQLLDGLEYLHGQGIVHHDLKPQNVLVDSKGRLKILDFGILRRLGSREDALGEPFRGTLPYMAPEQVSGGEVTTASDLYALGCILYRVLAGKTPFEGNAARIIASHIANPPPPLQSRALNTPPPLLAAISDLLDKDPTKRPSIDQLRKRLGLHATQAARMVQMRNSSIPAGQRGGAVVGRSREVAQIDALLGKVSEGGLELAVIRGESGAGKSALLEAVIARARKQGFEILEGRCYEREALPFRAFDQVVDELALALRFLPSDERKRHTGLIEDVCRLFPSFGVAIGRERAASTTASKQLDPRGFRDLAFASLRKLLRAMPSPILVAIDDLQWTDRESMELLEALIQGDDPPRMMVIGLARTEDVGEAHPLKLFLESERKRRTIPELHLAPFGDEEIQLLIEQVAGMRVPHWIAERVRIETDGNPFFCFQLAHLLARGKPPTNSAGVWQLPGLADLVQLRINDVGQAAQHVLALAAVAGGASTLGLLRDASGLSAGDFANAIDELKRRHLLRPIREEARRRIAQQMRSSLPPAALEPSVDLYHDKYRQAAYGALDADRRMLLHATLAQALEARQDRDAATLEGLARNWRHGGRLDKARIYTLRAAREAANVLAFARSAELYRAVLDDREAPVVGSERADLLESLSWVLENTGDHQGVAAVLESAVSALDGPNPDEESQSRLLRMRTHLADTLVRIGRAVEGTRVFERLLARYALRLDRSFMGTMAVLARLRLSVVLLRLLPDRWVRREPTDADRARLSLYERIFESFALVRPLYMAEYRLRHQVLAARLIDPDVELIDLVHEASFLVFTAKTPKQKAQAYALLDRADQLAEVSGLPMVDFYSRGGRGFIDSFFGQWEASTASLERFISDSEARGTTHRWECCMARYWLMHVCAASGDEDRVLQLARGLSDLGPSDVVRYGMALWYAIKAKTLLGHIDEAEGLLTHWEQTVSREQTAWGRLLFDTAAALVDNGRGRYRATLDRLLAGYDDAYRTGCLLGALNESLWFLPALDAAIALGASGQLKASERKTVTGWARRLTGAAASQPFLACAAHAGLGRLALQTGDRAAAEKEVRLGLDLSSGLGCPPARFACVTAAIEVGVGGEIVHSERHQLAQKYPAAAPVSA